MFPAKSLLSLLLLAVSFGNGVTASPVASVGESPVTLKFARNLNITGFGNIAEADRARAEVLKSLGLAGTPSGVNRRTSSFGVTNTAVSFWCIYFRLLLLHDFLLGDLHS